MNILDHISRRPRILFCGVALVALGLTPSAAEARQIGTVVSVGPGAFAERDGKTRALKQGSAIDSADLLKTDKTGRLSIRLNNGSVTSLGSNSELAADEIDLDDGKAVQTTRTLAPGSKPSWSRGAASAEGGIRLE